MNEQTLFNRIKEKKLFDNHQKVLIAVSGGIDSMFLLHFLESYQEKLGIDIAIAHVNHHQREQSQEEEEYLRQYAKKQGIPFYLSHFRESFSESKARSFRYAFFKQIMRENHYTALVTAHHLDDQAETIFMRLIRGTRLRYLKGIAERQVFGKGEIIRPLLTVKKTEIPQTFHFEDETNVQSNYLRNRIRNQYFPILEKENPSLVNALIQTSKEVSLLMDAFDQLSQNLVVTTVSDFQSYDYSIQYFLLQNYLSDFPNLQITNQQFDEVLHILNQSGNYHHHLKKDYWLYKDYKEFYIYQKTEKFNQLTQITLTDTENDIIFNQHLLTFKEEDDPNYELIGSILVEKNRPIIIRKRRPGDKIQIAGRIKKINRLYIKNKIPQIKRDQAIVIEQDNAILFASYLPTKYLNKFQESSIIANKLFIKRRKI